VLGDPRGARGLGAPRSSLHWSVSVFLGEHDRDDPLSDGRIRRIG
jgi:hypothetical protein